MLVAVSALIGCPLEARDGRVGTVRDLLVEDASLAVGGFLVRAGDWLEGRDVVVPAAPVAPIRLPPKPAFPMLSFGEQMSLAVDRTRAWVEAGASASPRENAPAGSAADLKGFSIEAADGEAGALDTLFVDDEGWTAGALVVATRGWFSRRLVRVPASAVAGVDRPSRKLRLAVTRERIRSAPEWDPLALMADDLAEARLRAHFGPAERRGAP